MSQTEAKPIYAWTHLLDKSHIHLSKSPTEPPPVEAECRLKAIYYDEKATGLIQAMVGNDESERI